MADFLPVWLGVIICLMIALLFLFWGVRGFFRLIGNVRPPPMLQKPTPKPQNDVRIDIALFLADQAWKQGKKRLFKQKSPEKKSFWKK